MGEIRIKLRRVREMLDGRGMEGLLLQTHPNFSWMTAGGKNFVANCFDTGAVALLITRDKCYAFCNVIEAPRMREEEHLEELGFELVVYPWQENRMRESAEKMVSSLDKVVSDTPMGSARMETDWIRPLRLCLTENEIARYLYLGRRMSEGLEEYLQTVTPGMTEYDIAGGISQALWSLGIEQVMHLVSADERADKYRHALPTQKKLEHNLIVSINGRYKGLVVTTSRMVYFGTPPSTLLRQYRDCCEMESLVASKALPGADEWMLYQTLRTAYQDRGYPTMFDRHGQGGCQGYWPREYLITPSFHQYAQENQAYCFNPVVDGTKSEDSFIVSSGGPLWITVPVSFPRERISLPGMTAERPGILIRN
jgi:antitoxin VapB